MRMRSRVLGFIAAGALVLMGAAGALAQDATPASAGENLFAGLGLPEITVTLTDAGYEASPAEVEAGRYLVTLNNESENPVAFASFVQLVEGRTLDNLSAADEIAAGTPVTDAFYAPENLAWMYETYISGGPSTVNDAAGHAVVNLPAGEYGIWAEDPGSPIPAGALTVTGDPDARIEGPEPEAAVTIIQEGEGGVGYTFRVDGEFQTGPQIVKILNASDQPHVTEATQYPEPVTIEQVLGTFMFDPSSGATPSPDMIDFERRTHAGWSGAQSIGTTQWVVMDFQPGQTLLLCFIPDPLAGGIPHLMEGMAQLFDVAES
jgi:hypothetical protein